MFIEMSEQLNQAEKDLVSKAKQLDVRGESEVMQARIKVVFDTLRNQLKSLEKEVICCVPPFGTLPSDKVMPQEDWELESRKHLARFNDQNDVLGF